MNWVGGARNRIKLKHERRIQKEFFEKKRHSKKVLRTENPSKTNPVDGESKRGISQDLIALQAHVSAHDKPKGQLGELRKPLAINLDVPKHSGRDGPRRSYAVELPESPGHRNPPLLEKIVENKKSSVDVPEKIKQWIPQVNKDQNLPKCETSRDQAQPMMADRKPFTINTWTDLPLPPPPPKKDFGKTVSLRQTLNSIVDVKPNATERKFTLGLHPYSLQRDVVCTKDNIYNVCGKIRNVDCSAIKQDHDIETNYIPDSSLDGENPTCFVETQYGKKKQLDSFAAETVASSGKQYKDKEDDNTFKTPKLETFYRRPPSPSTNYISIQALSPSVGAKPLPLESPIQTWKSQKSIQWSHFQIHPGHPLKRNPFFDKETEIPDVSNVNKSKSPKTILHQGIDQSKGKRTPNSMKFDSITEWNPFNIRYPVKIEDRTEGTSMKRQETAWRTFLKGSTGFQRPNDGSPNQSHPLPTVAEEAPSNKGCTYNEDLRSITSPSNSDIDKTEVSNENEALKEVMDLDKEEDQSSGFTSSWSTLTDEEQDTESEGHVQLKTSRDEIPMEQNIQNAVTFANMNDSACYVEGITKSVKPVSPVHKLITDHTLQSYSPSIVLECSRNIDISTDLERQELGLKRYKKVKKCLFPCDDDDDKTTSGIRSLYCDSAEKVQQSTQTKYLTCFDREAQTDRSDVHEAKYTGTQTAFGELTKDINDNNCIIEHQARRRHTQEIATQTEVIVPVSADSRLGCQQQKEQALYRELLSSQQNISWYWAVLVKVLNQTD